MKLLPHVLRTIRAHLQVAGTPLFKWDSGLVGDGCFFAGYLAAGGETDHPLSAEDIDAYVERAFKQEEVDTGLGQIEGVELSLLALREMRWCFAKAEEREQTIRMVCSARRLDNQSTVAHDPTPHEPTPHLDVYESQSIPQPYVHLFPLPYERPVVPPLNLNLSDVLATTHGITAAPHTGGTDASSSWPTYTPPGTGTSGTGTSFSRSSDSPVYSSLSDPHLPFYTTKGANISGEMLYPTHSGIVEMDPFSFSVPVSGYDQHRSHHDSGELCGWRPSGHCRSF